MKKTENNLKMDKVNKTNATLRTSVWHDTA